jgi:Single-strand binding protein family
VATHDTITKRTGERERRTEWHEVVVWGSLGERAAEQLRKGGRVLVEGQLHTRLWADFRGTKHITAEVHAKRSTGTATPSKLEVRPVLPAIRVPTLVLHRKDNAYIRADNGALSGRAHPGSEVRGSAGHGSSVSRRRNRRHS